MSPKSLIKYFSNHFQFLVCDNCTQTLLDTIDEIMYKFEDNMQDTNLHDLKAPWIKLYKLSNETDYLNSLFDEYFDAVDAVDNFNDVASEEVSSKASTRTLNNNETNYFSCWTRLKVFTPEPVRLANMPRSDCRDPKR